MKFIVALIAVVAAATAWQVPNVGRGELAKDIQDFVDLMNTDKLVEILLQYVAEDAEVQTAVQYMQSQDFRQLVQDAQHIPELINFFNYVYNAGVDIYYLVNRLNEYVHVPKLVPPQSLYGITGGMKGLVADIKRLLPSDTLTALYNRKLQTSPAFKELVEHLSSNDFQKVVDTLFANPRFQYIIIKANEAGLDTKAAKKAIKTVLGLHFPDYP